ncbi:MAG: hypothetical protein PHX83_07980 [Acidobacteriia bacterium]|nr:hypothetical protein [Terriglobia bacterium]
MKCPFLKETYVKNCQTATFRKMIVERPGNAAGEKCSTPAYLDCPVARMHAEGPAQEKCPFLEESLVQFCSAAPVTKFIPYSESLASRCSSDSHRFCDLFYALAHPRMPGTAPAGWSGSHSSTEDDRVEGIPVPPELFYSANHMWLDVGDDGMCHIGVDAFLARALGRVDQVRFLARRAMDRPTVVLTLKDVELQMAFPNLVVVTNTNVSLRSSPERLTSEPYGAGWLFETMDPPNGAGERGARSGLMPGAEAKTWMEQEFNRVTEFIQNHAPDAPQDEKLMTDGGLFVPGFFNRLDYEARLSFINQFFSPYANWRKWW